MPKFAPVAPIQILEGLWAHSPDTFGDYHLLLAHHTVAHEKRFNDLFREISKSGYQATVIMDNSIVELGDAVDLDMICRAVDTVQFEGIDVIPVLPDVMGQGEETRQAVKEAYPIWEKEMPCDSGFMVVCQGNDFQDYLTSLHMFADLAEFPMIEVLGVPRVLTKDIGSRIRPALSAAKYTETHRIHFLGFSDNVIDDIDSVKCVPSSGIDSAVPLRLREVFTEFCDAGKRPSDWFETAQVDNTMISNLERARKMFE